MLYKYFGSSRVSTLFNLLVRFSQPSALNDPFESAQLIDMESSIGELRESMRAEFNRLAIEIGENPDEETKSLMESTRRDLEHDMSRIQLGRLAGESLAEYLNLGIGVFSLSRANDNLLLWAHYAESHKGFVLGLNDKHPFFFAPDGNGQKSKPHNVIYTSSRQYVEPSEESMYEKLLCTKSIEWAYEEEVRLFRTFERDNNGEFTSNTVDQVHLFALPAECIREIYIGANANDETKSAIHKYAKWRRLDVKIFQAHIADDKYELRFRQLDIAPNFAPAVHYWNKKYVDSKGVNLENSNDLEDKFYNYINQIKGKT